VREIVSICTTALLLSAILTGYVRRMALARGLLDVPNARSSHVEVTPRAGGISFVVVVTVATGTLALLGRIPTNVSLIVLGGGGAIALVGLVDDFRPVAAWVRFVVHLCAAVAAVATLGGPHVWYLGGSVIRLGWLGDVLETLGIVWTVNLFNFMDGIDGIAASEAGFVCGSLALLTLFGSVPRDAALVGVVLGASSIGFLLWNWPPAKIFMGDVGSGYLGYVIAVLLTATIRENPSQLWSGVILGGVFYVDATVTLIRRALRGQRVYEAHHSHAYQHLAVRWRSHSRVTLAVLAVNLFWLLPLAILAEFDRPMAPGIALVALSPIALVAIGIGAGTSKGSQA
jgi:Fuc2NAc and GlcNAc transferase